MIAYTTPNGNTLFLGKSKTGVTYVVGKPTNRQGVLEWLLQNATDKSLITEVIKFMDAESEAANKRIQSGRKEPTRRTPAETTKK